MTRKHPLGIPIISQRELWELEAKRNNKTVSEVMDEYYNDVSSAISEERSIYEDKAKLLPLIQEEITQINEHSEEGGYEKVLQVTSIINIIKSDIKISLRGNKVNMTLRAIDENGRERVLVFSTFSDSGDYYNPPESESNIYWSEYA